MIQKTLADLSASLHRAESLSPEKRNELHELLATLEREVSDLSKTHSEHAKSITGFTSLSAHEATRGERNPELMKTSLHGLSASVSGFEETHPKLVAAVNRICTALSNMGI